MENYFCLEFLWLVFIQLTLSLFSAYLENLTIQRAKKEEREAKSPSSCSGFRPLI